MGVFHPLFFSFWYTYRGADVMMQLIKCTQCGKMFKYKWSTAEFNRSPYHFCCRSCFNEHQKTRTRHHVGVSPHYQKLLRYAEVIQQKKQLERMF